MENYFKEHCQNYPQRTWQDDVKWLYQATLGCEHFVSDEKMSLKRIQEESGQERYLKAESLNETYIRLHFSGLEEAEMRVVNRLFIESARFHITDVSGWIEVLRKYQKTLSKQDQELLETYIQAGAMPLHHSDLFRNTYQPHYRVILKKYWPYFDLLCQIEKKGPTLIGIDGRCGSGKSTMGEIISQLYHCPLIHMDDFYLPLALRTESRLNEPGGNVYYERFLKEVMLPIQRRETLNYGIFDHHIMDDNERKIVAPSKMYVIEGSYAFHPTLIDFYDYKIFSTINKVMQEKRILKRNGPKIYQVFVSRWIPLEERYFQTYDFEKMVDYVFDASTMGV